MNSLKKVTLLVFTVIIAAMFVTVGCDSDMVIGPENGSETATGPEAGPAPEKGKDKKEKGPKFGENYSTDSVITTMAGGAVVSRLESKLYNSTDATRTEMDMPMGTGSGAPTVSMVFIDRRDLGVTWQLFPRSKKYIEDKIVSNPAEGMVNMNLHDILYSEGYTLEEAGTETVNGYDCDKYILDPETATLPDITIWSAKKLDGVVVKTLVESPDGTSMTNELFNVEVGKPDASLFELPDGYTRATEGEIGVLMMQEIMGQ